MGKKQAAATQIARKRATNAPWRPGKPDLRNSLFIRRSKGKSLVPGDTSAVRQGSQKSRPREITLVASDTPLSKTLIDLRDFFSLCANGP